MAGVDIRPDELENAGRRLSDVAARFGDALAAFQAEISGYGQPWGSDDIGSLIGAAHDEVSSFAFECYTAALDEITAAGEDLVGMAEGYRSTDIAAADEFVGLMGQLGR